MSVLPFSLVVALAATAPQEPPPACRPQAQRMAERIHGIVVRGDEFVQTTPAGWILRLAPAADGWLLRVSRIGREDEDLARLTPPWHFVPNPRQIDGWHFRNADNTGPNDGSVNAPQRTREFIFSPEVGLTVDYDGGATSADDVARVRAYGQGWLYLESYALTPPEPGERAGFETMAFSACLTWPSGPPAID